MIRHSRIKLNEMAQRLDEMIADLNMDNAYEIFKQSYEKETGAAWDKGKFLSRARNWEFYGDQTGFVAVRPQRSGLVKITGAAGSPKGILKGIRELLSQNTPVWTMASKPLAAQLVKLGLIQPPAFLIKAISKIIPASVFGDVPFTVNSDGSLTFQYSDVGDATKYFVASPEYFKHMLRSLQGSAMNHIPTITKNLIATGIEKLL